MKRKMKNETSSVDFAFVNMLDDRLCVCVVHRKKKERKDVIVKTIIDVHQVHWHHHHHQYHLSIT